MLFFYLLHLWVHRQAMNIYKLQHRTIPYMFAKGDAGRLVRIGFLLMVVAGLVGASLRECPHGYFYDVQHCEKCQQNCVCSAEDTCDSCVEGYTEFNGACIACPQASGIYGTCSGCCSRTEGTILACTDCVPVDNMYSFLFSGRCILSEGCFQVDSNGFCIICRQGFYTQDNLCYTCDPSCKTCVDSDNCLTCSSGYYWKVANGGLCSSCPTGCATCTSDSICTSCLNQYYFYVDHCLRCSDNCNVCVDGSTCTECVADNILVSNLCIECTDTTYGGSTGCLSCYQQNNFIRCSQCDDTYFLDTDNNICRKCENYIAGALRCRDENTPTQCLDDSHAVLTNRYYLVGIICVHNTKSCKKIMDIHGNCSVCYDGYVLTAGECVQCDFTGCQIENSTVVSNVCTCTECMPGYYLDGSGVCQPCSTTQCSVCPNNVCSQCLPGFYFNAGSCSVFLSANCQVAQTSSSTLCSVCMDGFYLGSNQMCYGCQTGCLFCTDKWTCTTCDVGRKLISGYCVAYPSHCLDVEVVDTNSVSCLLCEHGYYLSNGICLECSVAKGTLSYCDGLCPIDYLIESLMIRVDNGQSAMSAYIFFCAILAYLIL